jgi:serine/threonine protein kinase
MSESTLDDRDPLERLAADFMGRRRRGETPSVTDYAARYPELAAEIEDLFPTIALMERLKTHKEGGRRPRVSLGPIRLERLGDFRILREIGRGGMGIVFEAFQESLGRQVAVKVLPRQLLLDPKHLARFHREAQTAARLHHTNIVPVFGVGEQDGFHYIVMQLIRGAGMDAILARLRQPEPAAGTTDSECDSTTTSIKISREADAVRPVAGLAEGPTNPRYFRGIAAIGRQVADAIHYAHGHQTLHRDIKPANVLLDEQGVAWVTDFGLAKAMEQDQLTQTGAMVGTLRYMAPEQFSGQGDTRSDIYSLGLTLYEMLTLQPAFPDDSHSSLAQRIIAGEPVRPRRLDPRIPADLETIVLKAIAREPSDRYATAGELAADLENFLEDRPIQARRASGWERLRRWARRNRALASLAASTLVLLVAVAVVASVGYVRTTRANIEETRQRKKAEDTSALALEALDNIFRQFAPDRAAPASPLLVVGDADEEITVPGQPVLSKETASLLEHMLAFYDRLAAQGDDARLRRKIADANRRVGDIRQRLGQNEESKAAYLRAVDLYAKLAETSGDPELQTEIARIHNELGNVYCAMNRRDEGRASYRNALATLNAASAGSTQSPQQQYELARTYFFMSRRFGGPPSPPPLAPGGRRGHRPEMPDDAGKPPGATGVSPVPGATGVSPVLRVSPHDMPESRRAKPRPNTGETPVAPGPMAPGPMAPGPMVPDSMAPWPATADDDPVEVSLRKAIGLWEQLAADDAMWPGPRRRGPREPPRQGPPPFFPGDSEESEINLEKAISILERLVAEHPAAPDYRLLLAQCYREAASQQSDRRPKSAEDATGKAVEILRKLVEEYPDVPDYRYDLSETYAWLGAEGRQSREILENALALSEELVAEHPNIPDYAASQVHLHIRLAELLWDRDPGATEVHLRRALDLQSALVRRFPGNVYYGFGVVMIREATVARLTERGQWVEARKMLEGSIVLLKQLQQIDSQPGLARAVRAHHYWNLADVLHHLGDDPAAAEAMRQAEELRGPRPLSTEK